MAINSLVDIVNRKLVEIQEDPLHSTEIIVLQGVYDNKTYEQIAQEERYSCGYITNVVAPRLYRKLSLIFDRRVNKKNCRILLESYITEQTTATKKSIKLYSPELDLSIQEDGLPCYPSGSIPLKSFFYIEHPNIQKSVYAEITKRGALIRIKAPREMGKTSLTLRILDYVERIGYRTVSLSLEQVDRTILSDANLFLRWLCANITQQLQMEQKLDEYWNKDFGSKLSSTFYLRNYVLNQINTSLVLALDEVNYIFEHPEVAKDFFPLLRSWFEEAKRCKIWQKLRLIVVHSTEIYVPLQLQQSPFNIGLPIQLPEFDLDQVRELAQRYSLKWSDEEAKQLMAIVGGHPALIHIALYYLSCQKITLVQLLETAPTSSGIYAHHLQRHLTVLQEQPELAIALYHTINSSEPVPLEPIIAYKLNSMGLIKLDNNKAIPSSQLYRQYFQSLSVDDKRQVVFINQ
ncbi:serine/threonine protein kinase [Nostoc linckia z18]|uniref:Serine/threonine protein kinase n=2 Tax=Nostoc linckia TaxID=92942 RepID=A0A9Q6EGJ7_NOSLI|nr:AAA-like domain-containing protein [Nostoc linckia]PHK28105.1 serine/threonine protein kinase [Nostoc linckia z15]PHK44976.1 serine/threonine protein kinase [Nostoc linckia z16]PHJ66165.1 serine/threonine protein kinase [Nostoc linckia z3]PHJ68759.1 serine/threonine protein kinase [Nostoc linckia z1]PHJ74069.1 serine/threonine protein kinase [Nostoc linckia z2]